MTIQDTICRLIARKLAGEASEGELKLLDNWLTKYPDFNIYFKILDKVKYFKNPSPADAFLRNMRKKLATTDYDIAGNYMAEGKFCKRVVLSQQAKTSLVFYLCLN